MKNFDSIDEAVDPLHEVVEEDDITETDGNEFEFGGEGGKIGEVMELGGLGEVQVQVGKVRATLGQLLQDLQMMLNKNEEK